ncbi:MAG TPA: hypothetical protein ENJ28_02830 [Gammaproteobacteria bacterium]|nr:hypothetical protein [Gammaproteobacteria bacterium]
MMFYYGLLLTFFLEYVRPGADIAIVQLSKINTLVPITVFLASLGAATKNTHADVWSDFNTKWLAFFMFMLTISLVTAGVTEYAFIRFKQALGYIFIFYVIARFVDDYKKLTGVLLTLCVIHVVLVLLNSDLLLLESSRIYIQKVSFLGDGNDFSLSLCIVFPMCFYFILVSDKKWKKLLFISMLLIISIAIIATQSRGASLALASVILYLWWNGKHKVFGIIATLIIGMGILALAPPEYFSRMETLKDYEHEGSAKGRIDAWKAATEMALKSPIIGVGAGQFPALYGLTAHSMYFLALSELGFPGLLFIVLILIQNLKRTTKNINKIGADPPQNMLKYKKLFICLNASLIGFMVAGAFLSVLYYPHVFVLSGIMLAANRIFIRDSDNSENIPDDSEKTKKVSVRKFVMTQPNT